MADFYQELKEWSSGVQRATDLDQVPVNAATEAWNTSFRFMGNGMAVFGRRPGWTPLGLSPLGTTPRVMVNYSYQAGSAFENKVGIVGTDGRWFFKNTDDTYAAESVPPANYPAPSGVAFSNPTRYPQGAVLNGRLFVISGAQKGETGAGEMRSFVGASYVPFGLSPIATKTVSAAAGGSASMPAETYDVAITSYNSTSGGESSRSTTASVTLTAGQRIRVQITPSASESAQYTHWRIYLRRNVTQAYLYQVQTVEDLGGANIVTNGNIPIANTDVYVDLSASTISNHIITSPDDTENSLNVPFPVAIATYGRRLFLATTSGVYWSKLDRGDNFPPANFEPIDTGRGEEITALKVFREDLLMIFTKTSVWGIFGSDPQSWTVQLLENSLGCEIPQSIISADGNMYWWSTVDGPVVYDGRNVQRIASEMLGVEEILSKITNTSIIQGGHDPQENRIIWAVNMINEDSITGGPNILLPFNYKMGQWEATKWDPFEVACMVTAFNANGKYVLYASDFNANIFYLNRSAETDGNMAAGPYTFTAVSGSQSSITVGTLLSTVYPYTSRKVVVLDSTGQYVDTGTISNATTSVLTLASAVGPLNVGQTYTIYLASPHVRVYTKWFDADQPFLRKRFDRIYTHFRTTNGKSLVNVRAQFDLQASSNSTSTFVGQVSTSSGDWEGGVTEALVKKRFSVGKSSMAMRVIVEAFTGSADFVIDKIAVMGRTLSDRYYYD